MTLSILLISSLVFRPLLWNDPSLQIHLSSIDFNFSHSEHLHWVYDTNGWIRDLPSLNLARSDHACASFMANGKRVSQNSFVSTLKLVLLHLCIGHFSFCSLLEAGVHSIRPSLMRRRSLPSPRPAGGPFLLGCLSLFMFQKQSALTIKSCFLVKTMLWLGV